MSEVARPHEGRRAWWNALRSPTGLPWLTAALVGAVALAAMTPVPLGVFWDDGVYLIGAKALATGAGYRFIHLPGSPAAVHFPPLFPALLAVVWAVTPPFPANVAWLKLVNPVLLGAGAGLTCAFGIRRLALPPVVAAITSVICSLALPMVVVASVLFSEPLFLVALVGALAMGERAVDDGGWARALVAGLTAGLVTLVRSAGIVLLPALVIALLLARRVREAAIAAVSALVVVMPWQLWVAAHTGDLAPPLRGSYGPYTEWVVALYRERGPAFAGTMVRENALAIGRTLGIALFPFGPRVVRPLLVVFVVVVVGLGMIAAWRRVRVTVLFALAYMALVLVWPYSPDRFLWAVWPVLGLFVGAGVAQSWRFGMTAGTRGGARAAAAMACVVGVLAAVGLGAYSARGATLRWWDLAARTNAGALIPVAEWVNANTAPGDIVACDGEPFVHLYTGRTVVPVHILSPDEYLAGTPLKQAAADLRALIVANRPRYAVFSAAAAERAVAPLLDGANGTPRLERIADLPVGGAAYQVALP